ncbi:unnamed protein product [Lactuca saligna]|uniref:Transposase MuDR plant domain-containing protein n=1 Tax=Lactuca saligna TaxID=75948 RepID=A0AA35YAV1_LACSI|nr:unnamed protein product [Lactuca saligna]
MGEQGYVSNNRAYTNIQVQVKIEIWGLFSSNKERFIHQTNPLLNLILMKSSWLCLACMEARNKDEPHNEYDADLCPSEESYHSHLISDNEDDLMNDDDEVYSVSKNSIRMEVDSKFESVVDFRRSLNHFAVTNEFNYYIQKSDPTRFTARCENLECEWRIHASITQDEVTFEVKKMVEVHTCT